MKSKLVSHKTEEPLVREILQRISKASFSNEHFKVKPLTKQIKLEGLVQVLSKHSKNEDIRELARQVLKNSKTPLSEFIDQLNKSLIEGRSNSEKQDFQIRSNSRKLLFELLVEFKAELGDFTVEELRMQRLVQFSIRIEEELFLLYKPEEFKAYSKPRPNKYLKKIKLLFTGLKVISYNSVQPESQRRRVFR